MDIPDPFKEEAFPNVFSGPFGRSLSRDKRCELSLVVTLTVARYGNLRKRIARPSYL